MLRSCTKPALLIGSLLLLAGCSSTNNLTGELSKHLNSGRGAWNAPEYVYQPPRVKRAYADALELMDANDDAAAIEALQTFNAKYPGYPGAHVNLAIVYDRAGRTDEALAELDAAEEIIPGYIYALNQRGLMLRQQGDFKGAEQAWKAAVKSESGYQNAWYNLGVLYDLYLQDLPAALDAYQNYQDLVMTAVEGGAEPDAQVAGWIIDLERRIGTAQAAQAAEGI